MHAIFLHYDSCQELNEMIKTTLVQVSVAVILALSVGKSGCHVAQAH